MKEESESRGSVRVGPAGWSYRDWVGPVYPPGRKIDQLVTISRYFSCIELNSSFYRIPGRRLVESWARRTADRPEFNFSIKVFRRFTHERAGDRAEAEEFIHAFDPLIERRRVGAFLLQFPWSFRNEPENRRYLERLAGWFGGHPTTVELRHGSWNRQETMALLSRSGLAFCNIDQPLIGDSIPPTDHVTDGRIGYIRLHGRNRRNWFRENAGRDARYDYLYSEEELEEWKRRALNMSKRVKSLFIITNNHYRGQALVNAFQLRYMLERRKLEIPPELVKTFPVLGSIARGTAAPGDLFSD